MPDPTPFERFAELQAKCRPCHLDPYLQRRDWEEEDERQLGGTVTFDGPPKYKTATNDLTCDEAEFYAAARTLPVAELLAERKRLREALKAIELTLRIPAAEYVPAISDVFALIDEALNDQGDGQ